MYFADNLLLLEMPKAGSTFMRRFLDHYYGKENIKKVGIHNGIKKRGLKEKVLRGDITVVSTIRNPFDWYVSLFAYTSMGKGIYRDIGFKRFEFSIEGAKSVVKNPMILFRDLSQWKEVVQDSKSPELFQKWIQLMLKKQPHYIEKEYGKLGSFMGYCTYRFLQLHTFNFYENYNQLFESNSVKEFYKSNNLPILILKTESIIEDILTNAEKINLDKEKVKEVFNIMKTKKLMRPNSSGRSSFREYYNKETIELIYEKDKFLLEQFDYSFDQKI